MISASLDGTCYSSKAQGTVIDTFDNILNQAFYGNRDAISKAFLMGVTRVEDGALGAIGNNIDSYLLGIPYPNPSYKVYPGALDLAEIVRYRTEVGIITGEIEVLYDDVARCVKFITPNAYGQFTVFYGFGFTKDAGLTYVPNHHVQMFRKIAAYEFLNSIMTPDMGSVLFQISSSIIPVLLDEWRSLRLIWKRRYMPIN
jgi:hypothetical protein